MKLVLAILITCACCPAATADRFITNDTVAGERPSSWARTFKLTRPPGLPPRRELLDPVFFFAHTVRSIAKGDHRMDAGAAPA